MPILPVAPVSRLIREAGAKRVSESARDALAEVLESYGLDVAREAVAGPITPRGRRSRLRT